MKKTLLSTLALAYLLVPAFALDIVAEEGNAFNKVMSKNRSSKQMEGSNYVEIKNSDDLAEHGDEDLGVTVDGTKQRGPVYNYVEIKNAKSKDKKFTDNSRSVNQYSNQEDEGRNIGVKVKTGEGYNRGYTGNVHNTVKIENSELE
ncbi:MAG: hypothetical protein IE880_00265 [Epsilonproteobacteria bacterium]|nr:hypothetical protein [Campylobacterota bacterium]